MSTGAGKYRADQNQKSTRQYQRDSFRPSIWKTENAEATYESTGHFDADAPLSYTKYSRSVVLERSVDFHVLGIRPFLHPTHHL